MPTPSTRHRRLRWTAADARRALAELAELGLALGAFAAREGIHVQRLYYWRRRLADARVVAGAKDAPRPEFIEIRPHEPELVEVVLRSGRVLRVSDSIAPSLLARLVAVLERIEPC